MRSNSLPPTYRWAVRTREGHELNVMGESLHVVDDRQVMVYLNDALVAVFNDPMYVINFGVIEPGANPWEQS